MAALVEELAAAKINLDLLVLGRRPDGYHELDSTVVFADGGDRLTFAPAERFELVASGPFAAQLPAADDNLIARATRRLAELAGRPAAVRITLDKQLPIAAGIGGGSADAAACLRGLARLWRLGCAPGDLAGLAQELGADVPACLAGRPVRMRGIGEQLVPLPLPGSLPLLLVNPGAPVATAQVFAALRAEPAPATPPPAAAYDGDLAAWLAARPNHLEPAAIRLLPAIGAVLAALRALPGCRLARMSGSGATCFGWFDAPAAAAAAAAELGAARPDWWLLPTRTQAA